MQLGCLAAIGALYMMWMGGQGLYTSVKNREPMELACGNYDDVKPNKEWLKLTGCELNVMESSYMEENGKITELYIPARGPGEQEGDTIYVLVATEDAQLLAMTNEMIQLESEDAAHELLLEKPREALLHQGRTRFGPIRRRPRRQ